MSNDALTRLKNRRRPSVPARDTSINSTSSASGSPQSVPAQTSKSTDTSTSRNLESEAPESFRFPSEKRRASQASRSADTANSRHLEAVESRQSDVEVPEPAPLDTKQSTMRLERKLSDRLQALGRQNKVCREALIEAMFEYIEANPEAQAEVLNNAQTKNEHRQQIANYKRAQSMMKRFLQKDS